MWQSRWSTVIECACGISFEVFEEQLRTEPFTNDHGNDPKYFQVFASCPRCWQSYVLSRSRLNGFVSPESDMIPESIRRDVISEALNKAS